MTGMALLTLVEPSAPASSEPDPDEPYEFDNRAFTPEAMDEYTEYLLTSAVEATAA